MKLRRVLVWPIAALVAVGIVLPTASADATTTATTTAESIDLDQWMNRPIDNLIALPGGQAEIVGTVPLARESSAKYFWHKYWNSPTQSFTWTVHVSQATRFNVRVGVSSGPGDSFKLEVVDTPYALAFGPSKVTKSMDLLEPGQLVIPAGTYQLRLRKEASATLSWFKSVELIRSSDYAAYLQRVADFKTDTSWLRGAKGYMVQWGEWSYPQTGPGEPFQDAMDNFDVAAFVREVKASKSEYAVVSVSWWDYYFPGPIKAIDDITGPHDDRTANRDLPYEVMYALRKEGIRSAI
ncbi:MAG: hypothetical protein ACK5MP_07600 [Nostocoides sp.]